MRDGQLGVCALHLCGVLLRIKIKSRNGPDKLGRCVQGRGKCRFWHPMQLSQVTRSQALNAVASKIVTDNSDLVLAAQAAVDAPGRIWKAEPKAVAGRR